MTDSPAHTLSLYPPHVRPSLGSGSLGRHDFVPAPAPPGKMIRKVGPALATATLLVGLAAMGYWMLFSNLAIYDDEGYFLISAREYFAHGGLYQFVYSQYGPAFYVLADIFQHLAGAPLDHTFARFITLALWLGTAGCCAGLVLRRTASRLLTGFTLTAVFLYLYFITDEPFHPGSLIIFLLALSVWLLTELIDCRKLNAAALVAGGMAAVLILTKINVGAFFVIGLGAWGLLHATSRTARRLTGLAVTAGLVLFAVALMHTLWSERWVQIYLAVFAAGAVTLVRVLPDEPLLKPRQAWLFFAGAVGMALVVLIAVGLRGTSVAGLLDGVLLGPLRHPGNYSYPVDWRPGTGFIAALSLGLALAYPWVQRRFSAATADRLVIVLRLLQTLGLLTGLALLMNFRVVGAIFSYVAPLIWTWVIPLRGAENSGRPSVSRGLLGLVLLLQYLHAYPVGGSQESWGTFLFIPLVALGLAEIREWRAAAPSGAGVTPRRWLVFASLLLVVPVTKAGWAAVTAHQRYAARTDLGLPGAGRLHLPESQATAYRLLALNAVVHGDQLFSLPGLFSFNLWTDLPTPTRKNTTLWFTLLNDGEQTAIIRSIEQSARPCIIMQESLVQLMLAGKVPIHGILVDYIQHHFTVAFRIEGFAFLVRTGRTIAPVGIAHIMPLAAGGAAPGGPDTELEFCLVSDGTPIATIESAEMSDPRSATLTLNASNTQATLVTVNRANQPRGPATTRAWPLRSQGLTRVSLRFHRAGVALTPVTTEFHLKDAAGRILGEIRINE
ncbi:MAG: hypothetical protein ABI222_02635 [Opitutaceae bacterium]